MGMNATQLIKMANQIGAFFASQPNPAQARADFAVHLKKQWDPQMRVALYAHIDATAGEGLSAFALEAMRDQRAEIEPVAKSA
ncbi:formate dehydrogenase subunit delta [Pseudomonas lalucatii]|uniref:Formate dehydrogenase subunit delta n=2 Tax=Pseudomonas lalucatii TaxID=1424203 RepID=A0ABS5Q2R4_9PSED|nr:formate dehydrogenase subunit delta [Pseudomonas lalucatii]MBS7690303.1 formate dehydrogenase subunit delta [Pseudomonas lalucatii]MBS7725931.1 formate dehydrogenase subunit delta [Pseudomonas lalucatii]QVM88480.1 formate dehydrogenase subunit delta [Pseudomonas lalucatii]